MGLSSHQQKHLELGWRAALDLSTPFHQALARVVRVPKRDQHYIAGISGVGSPQWGGEVRYGHVSGWSHEVTGGPVTHGLGITDEDLNDDSLNVVKTIPQTMAAKWAPLYEARVLVMMREGDQTTYGTSFSATATTFFATDHKYPAGCPYQTAMVNHCTASHIGALDVTTAGVLTVDEWHKFVVEAQNYIRDNIPTPEGDTLFPAKCPLILILPGGQSAMIVNALKAFGTKSEFVNSGESNIGKELGVQAIMYDATLSDANDFYFAPVVAGMDRPFIHAWWEMAKGAGDKHYVHKMTVPGSVADVDRDTTLWTIKAYEGINYGDFRMLYRCTTS